MSIGATPPYLEPESLGICLVGFLAMFYVRPRHGLIVVGLLATILFVTWKYFHRGISTASVVRFTQHPHTTFAGGYAEYVFPNHLTFRRSYEDALNIEVLKYVKIELSRGDFAAIAQLPRLFVLDLTGSKFDESDLMLLRSCGNLNVLVLDETDVSDDIVNVLEELDGIAVVSVVDCPLSDAALVRISKIHSMTQLAIGERDSKIIFSSPPYAARLRVAETLGGYYTLPPTIM